VRAVLAVTRLVDDQGVVRVGRGQRIVAQQRDPLASHHFGVPSGLGQEELQLLHWRGLRLRHRLEV
jgi:hypothetical protein